MKVFLDVMAEQEDNSYGLIDAPTFTDIEQMLHYIINNYPLISNLKQLDEEDKDDKGDLYFEVYVKKTR